jgi:ankyrin repeat protein
MEAGRPHRSWRSGARCVSSSATCALCSFLVLTLWLFSPRALAAKTDFGRDVQPLLKLHCMECHGPTQQMRGLRLDRRVSALPNRIGANGARIIPGNSEASVLYQRISGTTAGPRMPPSGPLSAEQIALVKSWIDEGAEWPDALSGERSATTSDPVAERIGTALRNGRQEDFRRILRGNLQSVNTKGRSGWTPLMYAAVYGHTEDLRLLLERGARPNDQNDDGATALMYAVDDPVKVRLLLEKGADPNLRSGQGRTALLIAAGLTGTEETVTLLLDKGVDGKAQLTAEGRGAVTLAALGGNAAVVRLLVDRNAVSRPFMLPALGCRPCVDILLPLASERELSAALPETILSGDVPLIRQLLDRGAKSGPNALQAAALSPTPVPADLIRTVINRGAKVDSRTSFGISVIDLAARQGNEHIVRILREAGATSDTPEAPALRLKPAMSARDAVERSLPLLQRADVTFFQKARCVSCHNNSLTAMTVAAARSKGLPVNEQIAKDQLRLISNFLHENSAGGMENIGIPGAVDTVSYILAGMAAENYPGDVATDIWARYLKNLQSDDGSWRIITKRPPLESSDIEVTAVSLRAGRAFGLKSQNAAYTKSIAAAVKWLESAKPKNTEDYAYKTLGLVWGGGSQDLLRKNARELLAQQRPDGGWGQLAALASDAYATGQALTAIRASNIVTPSDSNFTRGILFLLKTQNEDGSWYVLSRAPSIQPYFDSDFPYGHDQFISAAATNWATMALLSVVR